MRLSKVIKDLQNILEIHGDVYVLRFSIVDETGGMDAFKYSKKKMDKHGNKAKMGIKEFEQWVKDQKNKDATK